MNSIKNYTKRFLKEDSGAELIEWAIIVAIAVILVGVAFKLVTDMSGYMEGADESLNSTFEENGLTKGGGSGGGAGGGGGGEGGGD